VGTSLCRLADVRQEPAEKGNEKTAGKEEEGLLVETGVTGRLGTLRKEEEKIHVG